MRNKQNRSTSGIALLEVILALTIFSLVIVALARSLQSSVEAATIQQREQAIQEEMRSLLEWVRIDPKDPERIKPEELDGGTKITPSLTPLEVQNKEGHDLKGLYTLKIEAEIPEKNTTYKRSIQQIIYIP